MTCTQVMYQRPFALLAPDHLTLWRLQCHVLHAGMKGGSVQNPIHALSSFISDLHAPNGSVAVEGFYE